MFRSIRWPPGARSILPRTSIHTPLRFPALNNTRDPPFLKIWVLELVTRHHHPPIPLNSPYSSSFCFHATACESMKPTSRSLEVWSILGHSEQRGGSVGHDPRPVWIYRFVPSSFDPTGTALKSRHAESTLTAMTATSVSPARTAWLSGECLSTGYRSTVMSLAHSPQDQRGV